MTVHRKTVTFTCLNCDALYQVVKTGPEQEAIDRWVTCHSCGGPLPARDGKYVLKYFLLRKAIANRKWRRKAPACRTYSYSSVSYLGYFCLSFSAIRLMMRDEARWTAVGS